MGRARRIREGKNKGIVIENYGAYDLKDYRKLSKNLTNLGAVLITEIGIARVKVRQFRFQGTNTSLTYHPDWGVEVLVEADNHNLARDRLDKIVL